MTRAQEMIINYLEQRKITDYMCFGTDKVVAGDRVYTVNVYGDIMDAQAKRLVAEADIEHDLARIGHKIPTSWRDKGR